MYKFYSLAFISRTICRKGLPGGTQEVDDPRLLKLELTDLSLVPLMYDVFSINISNK
jgi:hypothetical protein